MYYTSPTPLAPLEVGKYKLVWYGANGSSGSQLDCRMTTTPSAAGTPLALLAVVPCLLEIYWQERMAIGIWVGVVFWRMWWEWEPVPLPQNNTNCTCHQSVPSSPARTPSQGEKECKGQEKAWIARRTSHLQPGHLPHPTNKGARTVETVAVHH